MDGDIAETTPSPAAGARRPSRLEAIAQTERAALHPDGIRLVAVRQARGVLGGERRELAVVRAHRQVRTDSVGRARAEVERECGLGLGQLWEPIRVRVGEECDRPGAGGKVRGPRSPGDRQLAEHARLIGQNVRGLPILGTARAQVDAPLDGDHPRHLTLDRPGRVEVVGQGRGGRNIDEVVGQRGVVLVEGLDASHHRHLRLRRAALRVCGGDWGRSGNHEHEQPGSECTHSQRLHGVAPSLLSLCPVGRALFDFDFAGEGFTSSATGRVTCHLMVCRLGRMPNEWVAWLQFFDWIVQRSRSSRMATDVDVLSQVAEVLRLRGSVSGVFALPSPWGYAMPKMNHAKLLVVTRGRVYFEMNVGKSRVLELAPRDVIALPHGHAYTIRDDPRTPLTPPPDLGSCGAPRAESPRGAQTEFVGLCCEFAGGRTNPILRVLPPFIHCPGSHGSVARWLEPTVRLIAAESTGSSPGRTTILDRLAEVAFIQLIRVWLESLPAGEGGWLRALTDHQLAGAIEANYSQARSALALA